MVLGPRDKRALRTRCQACAHRRIKCEGGLPCIYCCKRKLNCVRQAAKKENGAVFINHSVPNDTLGGLQPAQCSSVLIPAKVSEDLSSQFIRHFFTTFLAKNDFAIGILDLETIVCHFQSSPSLYHASVAIGALDLGKKSAGGGRAAKLVALTSYRTSVIGFQKEIQGTGIQQNESGLWTTLFLGLFELMYDVSGEGWVKHIFYGTSKILQLRGPDADLKGRGRSFFLTVRVFEICRSLIYGDPSFLSENSWVSLMGRMWEGDNAVEWHPKEALFDLMLSCSALSQRVWDIINPKYQHCIESLEKNLLTLAAEGLRVRMLLETWHTSFQEWQKCSFSQEDDPRSHLATIYYHGISIFLSGIFDYRSQFNHIMSPTLSFEDIQGHVNEILSKTEIALRSTSLAGILCFFPLRVAGARAFSLEQKSAILMMLTDISGRSFVVADAWQISQVCGVVEMASNTQEIAKLVKYSTSILEFLTNF